MAEEVDTLFQEAVDALRGGDRPRAKELLTRLLKTDQKNANYWVWMSAAVETNKERVYCLQTALQIDPENAAAKRGMVLLGAAPPDETIQPFPVNRPRAWEENLKLAHEKPKEKKPFLKRPLVRLAGLSVAAMAVLGLVLFGFILPNKEQFTFEAPSTPTGPTPTFTLTPTSINATARPSPTYIGPTPLWAFLAQTYTPTPFYSLTDSDPQLSEIMLAVKTAYEKADWESMRFYLEQGIQIRPDMPDLWYLIGESYRMEGKYAEALDAYSKALEIDVNFGPAYVGMARVALARDENADVLNELNTAIELSPNFTEAYIMRAAFYTDHNQPEAALDDLRIAGQLSPESALVFYEYARVYLALNEPEKAVAAAKHANELDITMLPVYLVLGRAYAANNQPEEAAAALETYVTYAPDDPFAYLELGKLHYAAGNYEAALEDLDHAVQLKNIPEARLYRGLVYVELGRGADAVRELDHALDFYPESFVAHIGYARALFLDGKFGSAAIEASAAFNFAETDEQKAQVYYWRAKSYEKQTPPRSAEAKRDWEALLALPESAVPAAWRREAQARVIALTTPTVTPTPTRTVTPTKTPSPTRTPSPGPKPSPTPTPR
ncbi:MAG: tetratricopeptide repeat protein [Chloroflexota bacterium]